MLETIYDAAFDRARFRILLEQLRREFSAGKAFIAWNDLERDADFRAQSGGDPVWEQRYAEHYWQHDVLRPLLFDLPTGQPAAVHHILARPEVQGSLFYREFLAPQRIVDNLAVNLIKQPGMNAHLSLIRDGDSAPFSDGDLARMAELIPHLTRAVVIQSRLVGAENIAESHRQIARGARARMILLSERLEVMDIDPELAAWIAPRAGPGPVRLPFLEDLRASMKSGEPLLLRIGQDGGEEQVLMCEAQPLERDGFAGLTGSPQAAWAVHVTEVARPLHLAYGAIRQLYGLTATERQVLEHAVESGDPRHVDERMGIGRATVRTHLHRIYQKTGTTGFGDLSRLAHRFARSWHG